MSFTINGQKIFLTRGDSAIFSVTLRMDGELYEMQEGDRMDFGIKQDVEDTECAVYKTSYTNPAVFEINPADTSSLEFGNYKYDVQFVAANGFTQTFIGPATFKLGKEVTVPNGRLNNANG